MFQSMMMGERSWDEGDMRTGWAMEFGRLHGAVDRVWCRAFAWGRCVICVCATAWCWVMRYVGRKLYRWNHSLNGFFFFSFTMFLSFFVRY